VIALRLFRSSLVFLFLSLISVIFLLVAALLVVASRQRVNAFEIILGGLGFLINLNVPR